MNKIKNRKIKSILVLMAISLLLWNSEKSFAAAIIDDEYEENDSLIEARSITTGTYQELCQSDEDWYKLFLGASDGLQIKINFDINDTWMNFDLLDESNHILSYGSNQTDGLFMDWMNNIYPKFVYIKVTGPNLGELYDIEVLKKVGEDYFENNDNIDNAKGLLVGNYDDLVQYDDDWFVFRSISENEKFTVEMNYSTEETLEIEFTDENGIPYDYTLKEKSWGKEIEWVADVDSADVYIHIYGNSTGVHYGLDLSTGNKGIPGYQLEVFFLVCVISTIGIFHKKNKKLFIQSNRKS